jgi:hypothetical protein
MNSTLKIINPIDYTGWDDLILKHGGCSFFHSSAWIKVLRDSYDYTPLFFVKFNGDTIDTVIPMMEVKSWLTGKRGVSLPFTDSCNVVVNDQNEIHELFNQVITYGKSQSWKYVEFRDNQFHPEKSTPSESYLEHYLDINEDIKTIYKSFRSSTQRNIKKAEKNDIQIEFSSSLDALKIYFALHRKTRKRQGLPPQPISFFMQIYRHILNEKKGIIGLARQNSRYIAAMVFFHFGKTAIYKFGASNFKYQHLRANNLLMWEAIKKYCEDGYQTFYFGRTDANHDGLRQYKMGWNPRETVINYYKYNLPDERFEKSKPINNNFSEYVMGRFPESLLEILGKVTYKHFG